MLLLLNIVLPGFSQPQVYVISSRGLTTVNCCRDESINRSVYWQQINPNNMFKSIVKVCFSGKTEVHPFSLKPKVAANSHVCISRNNKLRIKYSKSQGVTQTVKPRNPMNQYILFLPPSLSFIWLMPDQKSILSSHMWDEECEGFFICCQCALHILWMNVCEFKTGIWQQELENTHRYLAVCF